VFDGRHFDRQIHRPVRAMVPPFISPTFGGFVEMIAERGLSLSHKDLRMVNIAGRFQITS
jgi:hypothetical protein